MKLKNSILALCAAVVVVAAQIQCIEEKRMKTKMKKKMNKRTYLNALTQTFAKMEPKSSINMMMTALVMNRSQVCADTSTTKNSML